MQLIPKKTCRLIIERENHYLGTLKKNQPSLRTAVEQQFVAEQSHTEVNQGHGRFERQVVSVCTNVVGLPD